MKKSLFIYIFLFLFGGVMLAGCDDDEVTITGLAVTPDSVSPLHVGETQQFTATGSWSDGSTQDNTSIAIWNSSDSNVVTIDATGVALTKAVGTANISASYGGLTSNTVAMVVDPAAAGHVKVFITSGAYNGKIPGLGLAAADTTCTTVAAGAGLTGTWTAWLSDNTTDAADRINNGGGAPFQLINGTVIANNSTDLIDGMLDAPILIDESGNGVVGAFEVWTATSANGTNPGVASCLEWTTNDAAESGLVGRADAVDAKWSDSGVVNTCDVFNRLYCFADANSNDDIPPAADHVKVFITSGAYTGRIPGLGLAAADTACTDVATGAGLTGTWTAWLSDNTTDAVDRIFDGAVRYQLINGTIIANNLTDLIDGMLDSPILIDESGDVVAANFEVWTATSANGTNPGVASCLEWTTNVVSESGRFGRADEVDANWTDSGVENTCDVFNRLYCFADAISN